MLYKVFKQYLKKGTLTAVEQLAIPVINEKLLYIQIGYICPNYVQNNVILHCNKNSCTLQILPPII